MRTAQLSGLWLIVGLGNPGDKYSSTRHNTGFMAIDRLSESHHIPLAVKDVYSLGRGLIEGTPVVLLKPLTYMNLSGVAVRKVLKKFNLFRDGEICNLIVVHDDLDIETGLIKIRRSGSSGGHKGIESVIRETGTKDFIRVKIGIGRDPNMQVEEYVLRRFRPAEKKVVEDAIIKATGAVESIVTCGIEKAMNTYNRAAGRDNPPTE